MARPKIKDSITKSFSGPRKVLDEVELQVIKDGGWSAVVMEMLTERYAVGEQDSKRKKLARELSVIEQKLKDFEKERQEILELLE